MSSIRVTYSGLIALAVGLVSILTGMIFTLIVTRRLTPEEFGLWSVIGGMISYFIIAEPVISFWSTRQIARGEEVGKTSILSSSLFSLGAVPIYLVSAFVIGSANHVHLSSMILAAILIPVTFVSQTLAGINLGHKPHASSFGLVIFESLKIPVGLVLVYFFDMGVNGAIITTTIAYVAKIAVQVFFAKSRIRGKFDFKILKNWLRHSWLPLYSNVGHVASVIDVIIYSIITNSVIGVSYYAVSNTIASTIAQSSTISQALYPKLLAKGNFDYVKDNFTRLMYFAIPLLGICVIFSKPALFTLNPAYANESNLVAILAFRTFFYAITSTLYQILLGMETVDVEKDYRFSHLAKSKLFLIPSLTAIQFGSYLLFFTITIFVLHLQNSSITVMTTWWCVISLATQIPFLIYAWSVLRKSIKFSIDVKDVIKYISGTLAFCFIFLITSPYIIEYKTSIYDFLPYVILELAICIGMYLLITYSIDKKTRILIKSILGEIKSK